MYTYPLDSDSSGLGQVAQSWVKITLGQCKFEFYNRGLSSFSIIWWLDALKRKLKIIRENAFEQNNKKPELKFIPGLGLIGPQTTEPWRVVLT